MIINMATYIIEYPNGAQRAAHTTREAAAVAWRVAAVLGHATITAPDNWTAGAEVFVETGESVREIEYYIHRHSYRHARALVGVA